MPSTRVDDAVVDGLAVESAGADDVFVTRGRVVICDPAVRAVLEAFVTVFRRADAQFLLDGAADRQPRATDGQAFTYLDGGNVLLTVGAGSSVVVGEGAFTRLIDRWRAALWAEG